MYVLRETSIQPWPKVLGTYIFIYLSGILLFVLFISYCLPALYISLRSS